MAENCLKLDFEKKEIKSMFHCYLYDLIHANFLEKLKKILIYD